MPSLMSPTISGSGRLGDSATLGGVARIGCSGAPTDEVLDEWARGSTRSRRVSVLPHPTRAAAAAGAPHSNGRVIPRRQL